MKRKQIYALLMVMGLSVFSPSYTVFAEPSTEYTVDGISAEREATPDINKLTGNSGGKLSDIKLPEGYEWAEPDTVIIGYGLQKYAAYKSSETGSEKETVELDVYAIPTGLRGKYNQKITEVKLPEGFEWKNKTDRLSHVTEGTDGKAYKAIYTPEDTEKYQTIEVEILVQIEKADPEESEYKDKLPTDLLAFPGEKISDIKLPEGFQWQDRTVVFDELGEHTYYATYIPSDSDNYNVVKDLEVKITVVKNKQDPKFTTPEGLSATYGDTVGSITLPAGFTWPENLKNTKLEKVGKQEYNALFTPVDTKHYNTVNVPVSIEVKKKKISVTKPDDSYEITYGDNLGKIKLPDLWTVDNPSEVPNANVGGYKVKIRLNVDENNYEVSGFDGTEMEITVKVSKAVPGYTIPPAVNIKSGTKLDDSMLPTVSIGTYEWDEAASPTSSGTYYCSFYPTDSNNYKIVKHIGVKVLVQRETTNVKPGGDTGNNTGGNTGNNTGNNTGSNTGGNTGTGGNTNKNNGSSSNTGNKTDSNKNNSGSNNNSNSNNTTVIKPTPLPSNGSYTTSTNYGDGGNISGSTVKNIKSDSITVADASTVKKSTTASKKTKLVRPTTTKTTDGSTEETGQTTDETDNSTTTTTATTTADDAESSQTVESSIPENGIEQNSSVAEAESADPMDEENAAEVTVNEKKKSNGGLIAIICAVIGALGGGGFYYYKKNYKRGQDDSTGV